MHNQWHQAAIITRVPFENSEEGGTSLQSAAMTPFSLPCLTGTFGKVGSKVCAPPKMGFISHKQKQEGQMRDTA